MDMNQNKISFKCCMVDIRKQLSRSCTRLVKGFKLYKINVVKNSLYFYIWNEQNISHLQFENMKNIHQIFSNIPTSS
jgi:hypothetical protein